MLPTALVDIIISRARPTGRISSRFSSSVAAAVVSPGGGPDIVLLPRRLRTSVKRSAYATPLFAKQSDALARLPDENVNDSAILRFEGSTETTYGNDIVSEAELNSVYEDVLAGPSLPTSPTRPPQIDPTIEDELVRQLDLRLIPVTEIHDDRGSRLASALRARLPVSAPTLRDEYIPSTEGIEATHLRVITRLEAILNKMESRSSAAQEGGPIIRLGITSSEEWKALIHVCLRLDDGENAERTLKLMKRARADDLDAATSEVMAHYANAGDILKIEALMSEDITDFQTSTYRDLHIKTHLNSTNDVVPTSALAVLHSYETTQHPAPIKSYTRVISRLFRAHHSSLAQAQAWDLFSHMRYVAHPEPDAHLWALMIGSSTTPERALDLFQEIVAKSPKHAAAPPAVYTAVIKACARSGEEQYVNEAYRLARERMNVWPQEKLDTRALCALLEGAKRVGDLPRARWILAEVVRDEGVVGSEAILHVLHAYATYTPAFKREATKILAVDNSAPVDLAPMDIVDAIAVEEHGMDAVELVPTSAASSASFAHLAPQSRQELLHEVEALWSRINDPSDLVFNTIKLSSRIRNAYLSVYYTHAPNIRTCREKFSQVHTTLASDTSAHGLLDALHRCSHGKGMRISKERSPALEWAMALWADFRRLEDSGHLSARITETGYKHMIRALTINDRVKEALGLVREFVARYPPALVRMSSPRSPMRSTRTALVLPPTLGRPIVRLSSVVGVPDDTVPPLFTFGDIELLHHRLVAKGRGHEKDIAFLMWMCKSYLGNLRMRMEKSIRSKPEIAHVDKVERARVEQESALHEQEQQYLEADSLISCTERFVL